MLASIQYFEENFHGIRIKSVPAKTYSCRLLLFILIISVFCFLTGSRWLFKTWVKFNVKYITQHRCIWEELSYWLVLLHVCIFGVYGCTLIICPYVRYFYRFLHFYLIKLISNFIIF